MTLLENETQVSTPDAGAYQPMLDAQAALEKRSAGLDRARVQFTNAKSNISVAFGEFCAEVHALCERKSLEDVSDFLVAREDKFRVPSSQGEYVLAALNVSNVQRLRDAHDFSRLGGVDGNGKPKAPASEMFPFTSFSNSAKNGVDYSTFRKQFVAALRVNDARPADDQLTVVQVAARVKEDIIRAHKGITSEDAAVSEIRKLVLRLAAKGVTLSPDGMKAAKQTLSILRPVTDEE